MTGNDFAPFKRIIPAMLALLLFAAVLACDLTAVMASEPEPIDTLLPEATAEPSTKPTDEPIPEPTPEAAPRLMPELPQPAAPVISTEAVYVPMAVSGDYTYVVNTDGVSATITGYTGNGGNITIPATLGGYAVTAIGDEAFEYQESLTSVMIPSSVSTIGTSAFAGCYILSGVNIPNGVTVIEDRTFSGCISLTTIRIPGDVISIGNNAFNHCRSLTTIILPENILNIGNSAFYNCGSLIGVYLYGNAPSLGQNTFRHCDPEMTLFYKQGKTGYTNPWYGYSTVALTSDSIPPFPSVGHAGASGNYTYWAQDGRSTITEYTGRDGTVVIPSKLGGSPVTVIGPHAFLNNTSISRITLPSSITNIGAEAFLSCTSLTSINFPDGIAKIMANAFVYCTALSSISLPESLDEIEDGTFYLCYSLKDVSIPDGVTKIGSGAFLGCTSLEMIEIPDSVITLSNGAFMDCTKLRWAYFKGDAPAVLNPMGDEGPFDNCASGFTVYYASGATGFTNPWHGYPTAVLNELFLTAASVKNGLSVDKAGGLLTGVADGTSVSALKAHLINDGATIKVYNSGGQEYSGNAVGTGMTVRLVVNGSVLDELRILVRGDMNGDGKISVADYTLSRLDILKLKGLTGIYEMAGDVNRDGKRNVTDYTSIRLHILDLQKING